MANWRKLSTAPTDGTRILVQIDGGETPAESRDGAWHIYTYNNGYLPMDADPLGWRELPADYYGDPDQPVETLVPSEDPT